MGSITSTSSLEDEIDSHKEWLFFIVFLLPGAPLKNARHFTLSLRKYAQAPM
jgi:hypothetical protein